MYHAPSPYQLPSTRVLPTLITQCLGEDSFLEISCPRLGKGRPTGTRTTNHFPTQKWKINRVGRILYLLERRKICRKSREHFLNPKPLISRTPCLDPRRNPAFSIPTRSSRRCDELSFLSRRTSTDGTL